MTAYYEEPESELKPKCPNEPLTGPTRVALEIVKASDGYDFIERNPAKRFAVINAEHLKTFEGRREARGAVE